MPVEWAWLKRESPVEVADRGIFLDASGPVVVLLLHGLTGTPTELAYVGYHLQYRGGYTVSIPRLVNHGQPLSVLARTTWTQLYDSSRFAFLEAREVAREKGAALVVGGLSLGAVTALLLAAEFPEDVAGVACLSPTLFYDGWNVPWLHRLLPLVDYTPLKYFAYFREEQPFGLKDSALREAVAARYDASSLRQSADVASHGYAHFPVRLFCEMRPLIARCKRRLPQVTSPLLLIQAEHDDMTSPRNSQFIYERVGSARRELVLLQESYHLITADLERATVARRLQRFCESVTVPARAAVAQEAGRA
jgi:carboxylesterase